MFLASWRLLSTQNYNLEASISSKLFCNSSSTVANAQYASVHWFFGVAVQFSSSQWTTCKWRAGLRQWGGKQRALLTDFNGLRGKCQFPPQCPIYSQFKQQQGVGCNVLVVKAWPGLLRVRFHVSSAILTYSFDLEQKKHKSNPVKL